MFDASIIHKREKAKEYAEQPERVHIEHLSASFEGRNNPHHVEMSNGEWKCDCDFFGSHRECSHTMAMEKMMGPMVSR